MKRIISIALVACMLLSSVLMLGVSAADNAPEKVTYTPNTAYWAVGSDGKFTAAKNASGAYEIDSEEKLLGLAAVLNPMKSTAAKAATAGQTFVLTKDMDLNPHITDWSDPKSINKADVNVWPMISFFAGTLDGNGHTVKGVYVSSYPINPDNTGNTINFGMIGQLLAGGVQNIAFDNSFVIREHGTKTAEDRSGGFIVGILPSASTYVFKNIYIGKNVTLAGADSTDQGHKATGGLGGIVGEAGAAAMNLTMENIAFYGNFIPGKASGTPVNNQEAGIVWKINNGGGTYVLKNCIVKTPDTDPHISRHNAASADTSSCAILITANEYDYNTHVAKALINAKSNFVQSNLGIVPAPVAEMFADGNVADLAYWATDANGAFTAPNTNGVYEIDSESKLLGLSAALAKMTDAKAKAATFGKTFRLTRDMKMNENVTNWANVNKDEVTDFWTAIPYFYGTLDGGRNNVTGIYCSAYPINPTDMSNTLNPGMINYLRAGGGIRDITIDYSFVERIHGVKNDDRIAGFLVGTILDAGAYTFENIYIGANATGKGAPQKTTGGNATQGMGFIFGESSYNQAQQITFKNVAVAGNIVAGDSAKAANVGALAYYVKNTNSTTTVIDCVISGNANAFWKTDKAPSNTRVYRVTDEASATAAIEDAKGYMVETECGVLPLRLADMMAEYKWQATAAADGKFNVRIVAETTSMIYDAVGFKVTLYKNGQALEPVNNVDNRIVYSAVQTMNGTTVVNYTAANFNEGFMDGEDNMLFAITLLNMDADATWTAEVTVVYTIGEDVVEGVAAKTATLTPYTAQ